MHPFAHNSQPGHAVQQHQHQANSTSLALPAATVQHAPAATELGIHRQGSATAQLALVAALRGDGPVGGRKGKTGRGKLLGH